ncbi:endonuclease, partial [Streptomyces nanshensis]
AAPRQRIDAVFVGERVGVLGAGVPRGLPGLAEADLVAATDHLPVLAALRVPAG